MTALVDVRLVNLSLVAYRRASEHHDELLREFALITEGRRDCGDAAAAVPVRLLALIDDLNARFSAFTAEPTAALRDAVDRGDEHIDLVYRVPADVGPAAEQFNDLLDEADQFCRAGDLLTLATPPDAAAFRRWFLEEFASQTAGAEPTPWPGRYGAAARG